MRPRSKLAAEEIDDSASTLVATIAPAAAFGADGLADIRPLVS
jgi:hypothetical protein